jgi:hypothetical protein
MVFLEPSGTPRVRNEKQWLTTRSPSLDETGDVELNDVVKGDTVFEMGHCFAKSTPELKPVIAAFSLAHYS